MKKGIVSLLFFILISLFTFGFSSNFKSPLTDPDIPNGEHTIYKIKNGKEGSGQIIMEETVKISGDGSYYIVKSSRGNTMRILKMSKANMFPIKLEITANKEGYKINSIKTVQYKSHQYKSQRKENVFPVISNFDSRYALRGFPFENPVPLVMNFLTDSETQQSSSFSVSVYLTGREDITIDGRTIPSYVLEIRYKISGFLALFKSMLPKTKIWYSAQKPHYMVKYESKGGQGESGNVTILLIDYSGWK